MFLFFLETQPAQISGVGSAFPHSLECTKHLVAPPPPKADDFEEIIHTEIKGLEMSLCRLSCLIPLGSVCGLWEVEGRVCGPHTPA